MRKILFCSLLILAIAAMPSFASRQRSYWFFAAAVDVPAGTTLENGTDFTSRETDVSKYATGAISVIFTPEDGSTDTVDIEFEATPDGEIWYLLRNEAGTPLIQIPLNTTADDAGIVRVMTEVNLAGIYKIRIRSIENTDSVNDIDDLNVMFSMGDV